MTGEKAFRAGTIGTGIGRHSRGVPCLRVGLVCHHWPDAQARDLQLPSVTAGRCRRRNTALALPPICLWGQTGKSERGMSFAAEAAVHLAEGVEHLR